ncbi:LOW QUALITY PROTEIN: uncharacterized protein LOC133194919 [Saccostrea echinata]|uniref:LOW QUALITY PROTEIN: uncharacterized protein LOC133194919 n=1 Tax=Saccostrea echinata TaxID=191078 RepID=UPI002A801673|nr:LOW QUALITY PROTEIN: uncharacterized protein LOC133194919 [Saccostrea echinata]
MSGASTNPETKESIFKLIFDIQSESPSESLATTATTAQNFQSPAMQMQQPESDPESPTANAQVPSVISLPQTVPMEDGDQKVHIWDETEERQLISQRTNIDEAFHKNKNHDTLWQKIFENMNAEGIKVSKLQILNKYRNIKRKYKETIDLNKQTGNEKHEFKYQREFDNLFDHKASTKATVSFDSGVPVNQQKKKKENDKKKSQPKKRSAESMIMKMEIMHRDMSEQIQRHQEEKLRRFDRLIDIFERSVDQN